MILQQWRTKSSAALCTVGVCRRRKSPRVGERHAKSTNNRASANLHAISTCSGAAGGRRLQQLENAEQVIYAQRPTFLRAHGLKSFPRQKRTRRDTVFENKLRLQQENNKKRSSLAAYGIKSWLFDKFAARALHTPVLHHLLPLSVWFSRFLPGRKSAPLLINRVTHGE